MNRGALCGGGQGLQASLDSGQVLFPGAQGVIQLLPLLLPKGAVCAMAEEKRHTIGLQPTDKMRTCSYKP